jgi:hypothetical protein
MAFPAIPKDAGVWLDPMDCSASWAGFLEQACAAFPGTSLHRIPGWQRVERGAVAQAVEEVGMVRVQGLNLPLDVFRRPNGFEETDFEAVLHDSSRQGDGSYLPSPVDLIQTKNDTGRKSDISDIFHLEALIQEDYRRRLPRASLAEARHLLSEYSEWRVLQAALENPDEAVRALAREHLREFAAAGYPFSQTILEGRPVP